MKKWLLIVGILVAGVGSFALFQTYRSGWESGGDRTEVRINGHEFQVEVVRTEAARERGLSGRDSLCVDCGMLFVFDQPDRYGFWMKEMKFPLDIVWIIDNRVSYIKKDVSQQDQTHVYLPPDPADKILEIQAGDSERFGIREGSVVSVE